MFEVMIDMVDWRTKGKGKKHRHFPITKRTKASFKLTTKKKTLCFSKKIQQEAYRKSVEEFGESKVKKSLWIVYCWTRGDIMKVSRKQYEEMFEVLKYFRPTPAEMPSYLCKGINAKFLGVDWADMWKYKTEKTVTLGTKQIFFGDRLQSWTNRLNVAKKFVDRTGGWGFYGAIAVIKPKRSDILVAIDKIPDEHRFVGRVDKPSPLFALDLGGTYVPRSEGEFILKPPDPSTKIDFVTADIHENEYGEIRSNFPFKISTFKPSFGRNSYWSKEIQAGRSAKGM